MSDFVLNLSLLYCWIFGGSAWVLGCKSDKEKNKSVKLVSREGKLFENLLLTTFLTVNDILTNGNHHISLVKIEDVK